MPVSGRRIFRWPSVSIPFAMGLRNTLREGYGLKQLRQDAAAGVVVGLIALPLSMALAIASGAPPQHGLYTAIVAGSMAALLGGTRTSVTGPTAAFVVLLTPVTAKFGLGGLMLASIMAGVILILMGVARMGKLLQFVPYPVTSGFTAGIAVVIATLQTKDLLGLTVAHAGEGFVDRVAAMAHALPTWRGPDLSIGLLTLVILLIWPRLTRRLPAAIVALGAASLAAMACHWWIPGFELDTIASRFTYTVAGQTFHGIPQGLPSPTWLWHLPGPINDAGQVEPLAINLTLFRQLIGPATAIAMLGAIESLLCAVVADGMTGRKHDPDAELVGQGIGNIIGPLFGGIAATGAIARTAANIRAGAVSPFAAVFHSAFLLLSMVLLAPALGYLPMSSLAALLIVVAWNMSDARHVVRIVRVAPWADVVVLLTCFALTVIFDMVIAVGVGVILAAILFMQRMAALADVRLVSGEHPGFHHKLPDDVWLYEITGPLFFGAAEKAASSIHQLADHINVVVISMAAIPTIDLTGLVALESTIDRLRHDGILVILVGLQTQPRAALAKAGIVAKAGELAVCSTLAEAEILIHLMDHRKPEPVVHGGGTSTA